MISSLNLLPQIPVDQAQLRAALESVAIPGYNGSVSIEIGLAPGEGNSFTVVMAVCRRETKRPGSPAPAERQLLPDPERKKLVQDVIDGIRTKLFVRPILQALEAQFENGRVMKFSIAE